MDVSRSYSLSSDAEDVLPNGIEIDGVVYKLEGQPPLAESKNGWSEFFFGLIWRNRNSR